MNPDQTAPPGSSLILVHIVCNIDTEVHKQKGEQTTVVVNMWKKVVGTKIHHKKKREQIAIVVHSNECLKDIKYRNFIN